MPTHQWFAIGFLLLWLPWLKKGDYKHPPLVWYHLAMFLWGRLTETDADKAQRLIVRSQQLLDQARKLSADAQCTASMVDDEFERRLRLVAGGKGD